MACLSRGYHTAMSMNHPLSYSSLTGDARPKDVAYRLARGTLAAFIVTFVTARILVILIMLHWIPCFYLYMGQGHVHVHHLNYGIFLLSGVGGYLVFRRPTGARLRAAAAVYGVGLGLTFDEFGMWLHLGGLYWQRASFDAVVVVAAILTLIAVAPELRKLSQVHFATALGIVALVVFFGILVVHTAHKLGNEIAPGLQEIELNAPG